MGNQIGGMCCDGDNGREIKQVRQVAPAPKAAFETHHLQQLQQHSGSRTQGSSVLHPFASMLTSDPAEKTGVPHLRPDGSAAPRALPLREEREVVNSASSDASTSDSQGVPGRLLSPRPRPRSTSYSDSSSPSGSAGFSATAVKPPGIGIRAKAAFSHSENSPFQVSPRGLARGRTQSSANPPSSEAYTMHYHGRAQSSYDAEGLYEENIENCLGGQRMSSTRLRQGNKPVVSPDYSVLPNQAERTGMQVGTSAWTALV